MGRAAPQGGRQVRAAGSGTVLPLGSEPGAFSEPFFSLCSAPCSVCTPGELPQASS